MSNRHLREQIQAYSDWKHGLIETVERYRQFLDENDLSSENTGKRLGHAISALGSERLTIAVVAEFSRGKSELINALFFADSGRRILPTSPGRTTMCPTELLYDDEADRAYLRLLPIETRSEDRSVSEFRAHSDAWHEIALDTESPDQLEAAFQELVAVREASQEEAEALGLLQDDETAAGDSDSGATVEIPRWRHAIVSFPHPLLREGITILDTPGLNALGSEPELTLSMLPAAQSVLFVVGADTGVTKSDLDIWRNHIQPSQDHSRHGLAVVMNKIDTLWDDLKFEQEVDEDIAGQAQTISEMLGVPEHAVFPVSAQKGLVAQIRDDAELHGRSRLGELEDFLARDIVADRQSILLGTVGDDLAHLVEESHSILETRADALRTDLDRLQALQGKNQDAISRLVADSQGDRQQYQQCIESFQSSRGILAEQARAILTVLDTRSLDEQLRDARRAMFERWTTQGMRQNMRDVFDLFQATLHEAMGQVEHCNRMVEKVYERFRSQHGLKAAAPQRLDLGRCHVELQLRHQEADSFSRSPSMAVTEQGFVIRNFFKQVAQQGTLVIQKAHDTCDDWFRSALNPLADVLTEHKARTEKRLRNLNAVSESRDRLDTRITSTGDDLQTTMNQIETLASIRTQLQQSETVPETEQAPPSAAAS